MRIMYNAIYKNNQIQNFALDRMNSKFEMKSILRNIEFEKYYFYYF